MRKKCNIRIPKGKEVKNVKTNIVNGNIEVSYDLEDVFEPKDGDFVTGFNGNVFIVKLQGLSLMGLDGLDLKDIQLCKKNNHFLKDLKTNAANVGILKLKS